VERRAQALESIGIGLREGGELGEEVSARLSDLFERRLDAVRGGSDGEELRGYAWWFASGMFDAAWSLARPIDLLKAGGRVHPDHVVAEHLAKLRAEHPLAVVQALELLIDTGTRQWFVIGSREPIAAILSDALSAGGEVEERARDIVNRLVARGHRDFERLLPPRR
jgi:hypothetical protein